MQFLKKHYEKIILSLVLLGLAATAVWFYGAVEDTRNPGGEVGPEPAEKPWKPLDLTQYWNALKSFNKPPLLVLTGEHNLFNPVTWKRMPDGRLVKITLEGPAAVKITDITPLWYEISYDREASGSYHMTVKPGMGRSTTLWYHLNEKDKSKPFVITGTNAAPDGGISLTLNIIATGEIVNVTAQKPYKHVDGYVADLQYPPDNSVFSKRHVNDIIPLSQEPYKIIAITNNAVTVEKIKTAQKTPIEWSGH